MIIELFDYSFGWANRGAFDNRYASLPFILFRVWVAAHQAFIVAFPSPDPRPSEHLLVGRLDPHHPIQSPISSCPAVSSSASLAQSIHSIRLPSPRVSACADARDGGRLAQDWSTALVSFH